MVAREDIFQEIKTLTPAQQESVYSFIYSLKHAHWQNKPATIEPFTNEKDAVDFTNSYAEKLLNETR
jgi:hypothetical protein